MSMKRKRTSFKKLKEIADFRRRRRASYSSLLILRDVLAKSLPGQLIVLENSYSFRGTRLTVARNSLNHPCSYALIQNNGLDTELFQVGTYDIKNRHGELVTRNRGQMDEVTMVNTLRKVIPVIDAMTGYTEEVAATDKKLINVHAREDGITVTVLERDRFGRFLPGPTVDKDFPFFDIKYFKELSKKNKGVRVLSNSSTTAVV